MKDAYLPWEPSFPSRWDNSQLEESRRCMRLFLYRYCWQLVPLKKGIALVYGSAIHAMLAALYTGHPNPIKAFEATVIEEGFDDASWDKKRNPEAALSYLKDYVAIFQNDPLIPLRVEVKQSFPLDEHVYTTKIDLIGKFEETGIVAGLDHKTTSLNRNLFMKTAPLANQFAGYAWGLSQIFDTTTFGFNALYVGVASRDLRFQRYYHTYSDAELHEWFASVLWRIQMLEKLKHLILQPIFWEKNAPKTCCDYFSLCPYQIICDNVEDSKYLIEDNFRQELWEPDKADDGAECKPITYVPEEVEPIEMTKPFEVKKAPVDDAIIS